LPNREFTSKEFANPNRRKVKMTDHLLYLYKHQAKYSTPLKLFLLVCFNLIIAPAIYAASSNGFERSQAYALGILGIATLCFSIYLFIVMFQPEKF